MPVSEARVRFPGPGEVRAFVATPAGPPPWPALIVIHPITGLDPMMTARTRGFAEAGYLAIAPDVYSNEPGYENHEPKIIENAAHIWQGRDEAQREAMLATHSPQAREKIYAAREWVQARKTETYVDVVAAAHAYARARSNVAKIGSVGYCMGGRLTAELAALGVDLAAAVIYYGSGPKEEAIPNIRCPVQGHYAVTDRGITGRVYDFALAMKAAGKSFNYCVYDADHGFGEPTADVYNPVAAQLAHARTREFFATYLRG